MNTFESNILKSINNVDLTVKEYRADVLTNLINAYERQLLIQENCKHEESLNSFGIVQESMVYFEADENTDDDDDDDNDDDGDGEKKKESATDKLTGRNENKTLVSRAVNSANKTEGVGMKILLFIPRLIVALIQTIGDVINPKATKAVENAQKIESDHDEEAINNVGADIANNNELTAEQKSKINTKKVLAISLGGIGIVGGGVGIAFLLKHFFGKKDVDSNNINKSDYTVEKWATILEEANSNSPENTSGANRLLQNLNFIFVIPHKKGTQQGQPELGPVYCPINLQGLTYVVDILSNVYKKLGTTTDWDNFNFEPGGTNVPLDGQRYTDAIKAIFVKANSQEMKEKFTGDNINTDQIANELKAEFEALSSLMFINDPAKIKREHLNEFLENFGTLQKSIENFNKNENNKKIRNFINNYTGTNIDEKGMQTNNGQQNLSADPGYKLNIMGCIQKLFWQNIVQNLMVKMSNDINICDTFYAELVKGLHGVNYEKMLNNGSVNQNAGFSQVEINSWDDMKTKLNNDTELSSASEIKDKIKLLLKNIIDNEFTTINTSNYVISKNKLDVYQLENNNNTYTGNIKHDENSNKKYFVIGPSNNLQNLNNDAMISDDISKDSTNSTDNLLIYTDTTKDGSTTKNKLFNIGMADDNNSVTAPDNTNNETYNNCILSLLMNHYVSTEDVQKQVDDAISTAGVNNTVANINNQIQQNSVYYNIKKNDTVFYEALEETNKKFGVDVSNMDPNQLYGDAQKAVSNAISNDDIKLARKAWTLLQSAESAGMASEMPDGWYSDFDQYRKSLTDKFGNGFAKTINEQLIVINQGHIIYEQASVAKLKSKLDKYRDELEDIEDALEECDDPSCKECRSLTKKQKALKKKIKAIKKQLSDRDEQSLSD